MKTNSNKGTIYEKCYNKRKRLFGIKVKGQKGWYVEPCFEELGTSQYVFDDAPDFGSSRTGVTDSTTWLNDVKCCLLSMASLCCLARTVS